MPKPDDERMPWERLTSEPGRAYHAFAHYRDLRVHSASAAWRLHKKDCDKLPVADSRQAPKRWKIWSRDWDWIERARLWDNDVDRRATETMAKERVDARARHARTAAAAQTVLVAPVRAVLDVLGNPAFLKSISDCALGGPSGAFAALALAIRSIQGIPSVVTMERLALGMSTESVEVDDKRDFSYSAAVRKDPIATDLAIQLLDRIAGTGPGTPERPGASGEPGHVADGTPPQPPHS